jgi:hypothetical protein
VSELDSKTWFCDSLPGRQRASGLAVRAKKAESEDNHARYLLVALGFRGTDTPPLEKGTSCDINWGILKMSAYDYDALLHMNFAAGMIPVGRSIC